MSDQAASDVVGSVLMAAMLVAAAGASMVFLLSEHDPQGRLQASFVPDANDGELRLVHKGGSAVPASVAGLYVTADGVDQYVPLDTFHVQIGDAWDVGESLCLVGPGAGCSSLFLGQTITSIRLVHHDIVEYQWQGEVSAPLAFASSQPVHAPNLDVAFDRVSPSPPTEGVGATFFVTITNTGTADIQSSSTIDVDFHVDGTFSGRETVPGPLRALESIVVTHTWTTTPGSHTATATADPDDTISESDETDNVDSLTFTAVPPDPGVTAFDDADCDRIYTDGIDTDVTAQIAAGWFVTPACLVVTTNHPTIRNNTIHLQAHSMYIGTDLHTTGAGAIELVTTGGDLDLEGVELHTSGAGSTLSLTSAEDITFSGSASLKASGSGTSDLMTAVGSITLGSGTVITMSGSGQALSLVAGTTLDVVGTTLQQTSNTGSIALTSGDDMDLTGSILKTGKAGTITLDLSDDANTLTVASTTFDDGNDEADVTPCPTVSGTPASGSWVYTGSCGSGS